MAAVRVSAIAVWDVLTLALNGLAFVLIGLQFRHVTMSAFAGAGWALLWLAGAVSLAVVLARALVEPCRLLYLDEPTGAMDSQTERWFIERLERAIPPEQTLIVSTHRNAMLNIVDRLIVIDQGRIIADGPRDSVLSALSGLDSREAAQ